MARVRLSLGLICLVLASPAVAQVAPPPASRAPAPAVSDAAMLDLRQRLLEAQQEIVRLRAEAAGRGELETALKAAHDKNARLVAIANDLIRGYALRYRRGRFPAFDAAHRRFETELQDTGDRVYDNRWNAGPRAAPKPAPAQPGSQ